MSRPRPGAMELVMKKTVDRNAGSILGSSLSQTEGNYIRAAFTSLDAGGLGLGRDQLRSLLHDLVQRSVVKPSEELSEDAILARYLVSCHNPASHSSGPGGEVRISLEEFLRHLSHLLAPSGQHGEQLRRACARGEEGMIRELLDEGVNPNVGDGLGRCSLHYAAQYNQVEVINLLKKLCGDPLLIDAKDKAGWTPLAVAVTHGTFQAAELLISLGARVDSSSCQGRTPLHWAAKLGREDMVQLLLRSRTGVNVNVADRTNATPLHYAAMNRHLDVLRLLLQHGADEEAEDVLGYTPKRYAGEEEWSRAIDDRHGSAREYTAPESYPRELLASRYSTLRSGAA